MALTLQTNGKALEVQSATLDATAVGFNALAGAVNAYTKGVVTLPATADGADDYYKGLVIEIWVENRREAKLITSYDGQTAQAYTEDFTLAVSPGDLFVIHRHSGVIQTIPLGMLRSLKLNPTTQSTACDYKKALVTVHKPQERPEYQIVESYNPSTNILTTYKNPQISLVEGDLYTITGESAHAGNGTVSNLVMGPHSTAVVTGIMCTVISGTNVGESRRLTLTAVYEEAELVVGGATAGDWFTLGVAEGDHAFWIGLEETSEPAHGAAKSTKVLIESVDDHAGIATQILHCVNSHPDFAAGLAEQTLTIRTLYSGVRNAIAESTGGARLTAITKTRGAVTTATVSKDWPVACDTTTRYLLYGGFAGSTPTIVTRYANAMTTVSTIKKTLSAQSLLFQGITLEGMQPTIRDHQFFDSPHQSSVHGVYLYTMVNTGGLSGDGLMIHTRAHTGSVIPTANANSLGTLGTMTVADTRAIVMGSDRRGVIHPIHVSSSGKISANIESPLSAFGELLTTSHTPLVQIKFIYGLLSQQLTIDFTRQGGVRMVKQGDLGVAQVIEIRALPQRKIANGEYFWLFTPGTNNGHYVWFDVGGGSDPSPSNPAGGTSTGIPVDVSGDTTPTEVAVSIAAAVDADAEFVANSIGSLVTVTNETMGVNRGPLLVVGSYPGSAADYSGDFATAEGGILTVDTDRSTSSTTVVNSRRYMAYRAGQGSLWRGSALFPELTSEGSASLIGIGNACGGFYFGRYGRTTPYSPTMFGIIHAHGGLPEIVTLTITSVERARNGDVEITLDGVSYQVNVASVSTTEEVAATIAAADFSAGAWKAHQNESDVVFVSQRNALLMEDCKRSNAIEFATSTNITATITTTLAGVDPVFDHIPQADWSEDRMDGTGHSGRTLHPKLGNVYQIFYQWHGFGGITFCVEDQITTKIYPVHQITYANTKTIPSLRFPNVQGKAVAISATDGSCPKVQTSSIALNIQGGLEMTGAYFTTTSNQLTPRSSDTSYISMILRMPESYLGLPNTVIATLSAISLINDGKNSGRHKMLLNPTITQATSYTRVDPESALQVWAPTTLLSTGWTGGQNIGEYSVGGNTGAEYSLLSKNILVNPGDTILLTVRQSKATTASISFFED